MVSIILILEVMDKEPPLSTIWIVALIIGVAGFVICKYRYISILLFLPLALLLSIGFYRELNDAFVGSAIRHEAGSEYVYQSYLAMAIAIIAPLFGALLGYKQQRRLTSRSS